MGRREILSGLALKPSKPYLGQPPGAEKRSREKTLVYVLHLAKAQQVRHKL